MKLLALLVGAVTLAGAPASAAPRPIDRIDATCQRIIVETHDAVISIDTGRGNPLLLTGFAGKGKVLYAPHLDGPATIVVTVRHPGRYGIPRRVTCP